MIHPPERVCMFLTEPEIDSVSRSGKHWLGTSFRVTADYYPLHLN